MKLQYTSSFYIFLIINLLLLKSAFAATIYDEAISGDILGQTFVLHAGVNTISGETSRILSFTNSVDYEYILFSLDSNTKLTNISFAWNALNSTDADSLGANFTLGIFPTTVIGETIFFASASSPYSLYQTYLPNSVSEYTIGFQPVLTATAGSYSDVSFNYDLSFTVESVFVPLPATIWLFISGILCLTGLQRSNA